VPSSEVAAFRERVTSAYRSTIALEMIGPIPGTLSSRSQHPGAQEIRSSSRRQSPARSSVTRSMQGDRASQDVANMRGNSDCNGVAPAQQSESFDVMGRARI
jgi:hypothetical protein